jgi:hypothetical protein
MNQFIHPRDLVAHPDAVYIGREHAGRGRGPSFKRSPWANPWNWRKVGRARAVELFAAWVAGDANAAAILPPGRWPRPTVESIRQALAGRTLACWCPCGEPCHGRVLAEIACGPAGPAGTAGAAPTSVILTGDCLEHLAAMEPGTVDLVVDPFTGSGTTGVVCADSGRRFVGIELREQFAAIARSRISTTASEGLAVSRMVGLKP